MINENEEKFFEYYSLVCRSINTPLKLRILEAIQKDRLNVSEIQEKTGVSMSNLSNNLNALYKIGILGRKKEGNYIYYYLEHYELLDVIKNMKEIVKLITLKRNNLLNFNKIK
jgi:ArsR family transcriptional regulator